MHSRMAKSSKRGIIFAAAAKLFRDRGYQATSMRDLAEAVDLKASSLYNHIGSKEEILKEICLANADRFSSGMQEILNLNSSPLDKIKALIHLHIKIAIDDYTSVTSFNDEWRHLGEPALSDFKEKRKKYESEFLSIIKEGIEQDQIKSLNPLVCLYTILSSTQWVYDAHLDLKPSQISIDITNILVRGISSK